MDKKLASVEKRSSYERSTIFSKLSFWWVKGIINLGRQNKLTENDLEIPTSQRADVTYDLFKAAWEEELKKDAPNIVRAIRKCFWKDILAAAVFKLFWGALVILGAFFFVRSLVSFVQTKGSYTEGWILAVFFFVDCVLFSLCLEQMSSRCSIAGVKIRSALMTAIYQKSLKTENPSSGDIINLVGNDCSKILEGCTSLHYLWSGPLEALAIIAVLISLIGESALVGLGLLFVIIPVLYFIGAVIAKARERGIGATEKRVQIVSEVLLAIKLVKFYAWEDSFAKSVAEIRSEELKLIRTSFISKTFALMVVFLIPPLIALCIFSTYIETTGNKLTPVIAFTTLSLFNTLRFPLVVLPKAIRATAEAAAGLKRIQAFLLSDEMKPIVRSKEIVVTMNDATIAYTENGKPILEGVTFNIPPGKLMGISGPVASGKSTVMSALLGETKVLKGEVKLGGKLAYVPQTPWIQHGTVRDNILFGLPFDSQKYKDVIYACALETDLEIMPHGDMTVIGERGINLSGGQRQRISLARAAYSEADVYLLDSPLSAVDQLTCSHIFLNCIKGILAGKTILLVTHQLHLLPEFDLVGIIINGKMEYCGKFDESSMKKYFPQYQAPTLEQRSKGPIKRKGSKLGVTNNALPTPKFEKRGIYAYIDYAREIGYGWCFFSLLVFMATQVIRIMSDYWISVWTRNVDDLPQTYYIGVYGGFVGGFCLFLLLRGFVFYSLTLRAATKLHNNMFKTILRGPMSYFTITPLGGIINSFSKDQSTVDESLPDSIHMATIYTMILMTTLILVCTVFPYYVLIALGLLCSFIGVQYYYLNSVRFLKLLTSETNSSIFAHFSESLSGLSVIRAFESEDRFRVDNRGRIDRNHKAQFNLDHVQLWSSFCLDGIGSLLVFATCLFCVGLHEDLNPASAGLAISNSIQKLVFFSMLVRAFADIEAQINSVDMIAHHYSRQVPSEPDSKTADPPSNWPPKGQIEFSNVVMRYFPQMDPALNSVSFTIRAGEKIGVVGRTGSGKTSLLMSLFRLVENDDGAVIIDGMDVSKFSLTDLRSRLAIIPQEPVLFKGTIRTNLDPFNQHTDHEIWRACELAHLEKSIQKLPEKLEFPITENGNNFSLGEKQLFCLARAILNASRVLALDEATAAMDLETDALIQKTIRKAFKKNTIITIAHRLDTVIDYDKILVMEAGKVIEFDTVNNLISNPNSAFAKLASEAGITVDYIQKHKDAFVVEEKNEKKEKKEKKAKKDKKSKKSKKQKKEKDVSNTEPAPNE